MTSAMRSEEEIKKRMEEIKKLNRGWYWKKHKLAELEWVLNSRSAGQASADPDSYMEEKDTA